MIPTIHRHVSTMLVAALVLGGCAGDGGDDPLAAKPVPSEDTAEPDGDGSAPDDVDEDGATPGRESDDADEQRSEEPADAGDAARTDPTGDPRVAEQWALDAARVPPAWAATEGAGVVIAVIDTGVDLDHPDLAPNLVAGYDFVDGDTEPDDPNGHGTHVAGVAAAAGNGVGIVGAAPRASVMPIRVLDEDGAGSSETIAAAVDWAVDNGADVINLSLGESGFISRFTRGGVLNEAIRDATARGVVVVAASGNEGAAGQQYRIGVDVLVVNATDRNGELAVFSNVGDARAISAPGVGILSTAPTEPTAIWPSGTDGYAELDGTSMATPLVSGIAAMALAAGTPPSQVIDLLVTTSANPELDPTLGAGIVDGAAALGVAAPLGGGGEAPTTRDLVVDRLEDAGEALRGLAEPLAADCEVTRRSLTVRWSSPQVEGLRLTGELVVLPFAGAGTYPAAGQATLETAGSDPQVVPVAGTATVDAAGAGSLTVPGAPEQASLRWTC